MKELVEIPAEQTTAMKASTLRELMKQLNISNEKFEEIALNPPTAEEQKEAALNLSLEMNKINEVAQEEAKVNSADIEPVTFVHQLSHEFSSQVTNNQTQVRTIEPEVITNFTKKTDDSNSKPVEESQENRKQLIATTIQIQQFVIPVIVDRINTYGKADKDTRSIFYKGEEYTAILKLEKDSQILSLDRNYPELEESKETLLASCDNNSEEYSIIINNLTKEEFERFQVLFQEQQVLRRQNQQQIQSKESGNELS
ncbi:hypothetical protein DP113_34485 (plasmid) [Brasilonema octagenarum UFV-E1]|uniref:Uncharacterized protein n=2 Tax=Brasilonema TaxID=383614 RepID=A0A856MN27_9CYAN|nr:MULTISPECIES: hypothetical protein [Brasilonema]NMF63251.1 hypothetical protein [Brasilonema octagenarum UFV-OR1]QDL12823.1 hypothetical protein DP114_34380 [Brasilonema sennae CENA114]QDL19219.1 hypothetical protein DP113_34485 [Brasilonema octagenarum UFV-E1]